MPTKPTPFKSPVQFLAFGFGSGLAPKAPGTWGSLAALLPAWFLLGLTPLTQLAVIVIGFAVGVWACSRFESRLGDHDNGAIVWDAHELVAPRAQQIDQRPAEQRVGNQDGDPHAGAPCGSGAGRAARWMRMPAPPVSDVKRSMRPSCSSATSSQKDSPRPLPSR